MVVENPSPTGCGRLWGSFHASRVATLRRHTVLWCQGVFWAIAGPTEGFSPQPQPLVEPPKVMMCMRFKGREFEPQYPREWMVEKPGGAPIQA